MCAERENPMTPTKGMSNEERAIAVARNYINLDSATDFESLKKDILDMLNNKDEEKKDIYKHILDEEHISDLHSWAAGFLDVLNE